MAVLDRIAVVEAPADFSAAQGRLTLRRAWPRDADQLLLEFESEKGRKVAGQWFRHAVALEAVAAATARRAPHGDVAVLPEHGLLLQANGADRKLRALAALAAMPGATLVSHRPEHRAVVRTGSAFAKVLRPKRAEALHRNAAAVSECATVRTPRLLRADAANGVTLWSALRGRPLTQLLALGAPTKLAYAVGRALRAFHGLRIDRLPVHDAAAERRVVAEWLEHVRTFFPRFGAQIGGAPLDGRHPWGSALVPAHRDFHDKQALLTETGGVGVLDLDTMALAERALDLANALVHLELRAHQGRFSAWAATEAAQALLDGYEPDAQTLERLPTYSATSRLRLACVYSFRPRWQDVPGALLQGLDAPPLGCGARSASVALLSGVRSRGG